MQASDDNGPASLQALQQNIAGCTLCPRLVEYRQRTAREKRREFRNWEYWGKPVPSFGDPSARLLIVGLAPAAHGGNRTGRMFTGDRSGDWLFATLFRFGFCNSPYSRSRDDGLTLIDAYVTASARCAPPDNKPLPQELANCRPYLLEEVRLLRHPRVVVALGRIAFDTCLLAFQELGMPRPARRPRFAHGATYAIDERVTLVASYHPSQRNTQTGKLTQQMFDGVFVTVRRLLEAGERVGTGARREAER